MPKLNTIDVKGEIEKRLKDPEFLREWIDAQIEGVFPQIMKAHAEIWRAEYEQIRRDIEDLVFDGDEVGLDHAHNAAVLCNRIAERYESKAAQETEG